MDKQELEELTPGTIVRIPSGVHGVVITKDEFFKQVGEVPISDDMVSYKNLSNGKYCCDVYGGIRIVNKALLTERIEESVWANYKEDLDNLREELIVEIYDHRQLLDNYISERLDFMYAKFDVLHKHFENVENFLINIFKQFKKYKNE